MWGSRGRDRIEVGFTDAISDYYHYCCELESRSGIGILDTTLCNKDYQCLAAGRWFSPDTPVSFKMKIWTVVVVS